MKPIDVTAFVFEIRGILKEKNKMDDFEDAASALRSCLDHEIDEARNEKIDQGIF